MTRARTIYSSRTKMALYLTKDLARDQDDLAEAGQRLDDNIDKLIPDRSIIIDKFIAKRNVTYDQSGTVFLHRKKDFFYRSTSKPLQCF